VADVLLHAPAGLTIITAADAGQAVLHNGGRAKENALEMIRKLADAADLVLIDAGSTQEPSAFAAAAEDIVIVVSASSTSITGGYTALKRMSRTCGRKRFHLLVNRVDEEGVAQRVQSNMAAAATKHLGIEINYMGAVPRDAAVVKSARCFISPLRASALPGAPQHYRTHAAAISESSAAQDSFTRLDNFMQRAIYGNLAVGAGV
jgi:flagellar biosynthesis protein FlhG